MSKYATLIAQIAANIRRNGAQAITGDLLQEQLLAMITSLGEYYQFGGIVSKDTEFTPGDEPVVFIAATPGTYTNFGGLVVADGEVALLVWDGSAWSKQTTDIATRAEVSQLGQQLAALAALVGVRVVEYTFDSQWSYSNKIARIPKGAVIVSLDGVSTLNLYNEDRSSYQHITSNSVPFVITEDVYYLRSETTLGTAVIKFAYSGNADSTPTAGSKNVVTSEGIKSFVENSISQSVQNPIGVSAFTNTNKYVDGNNGNEYSATGYYCTNHIPLIGTPFKILQLTYNNAYGVCAIAFYDINKNFISSYANFGVPVSQVLEIGGDTYPIPSNAVYARFNTTTPDLAKIDIYGTFAFADSIGFLNSMFELTKKKMFVKASANSLNNGEYVSANTPNNANGTILSFHSKITSFNAITIQHGLSAWEIGKIMIDGENVYVYSLSNPDTVAYTYAHGLTISTFIDVQIVSTLYNGNIRITTLGGQFEQNDIHWTGCGEKAAVTSNNSQLTDCVLVYGNSLWGKDTWVFGDSYLTYWCAIAIEKGFGNCLFDGFPGAGVTSGYQSLLRNLEYATPKRIVWALGMNNPDSGAINSTWLSTYNNIVALCKIYKIELVLVTIPNVPERDNSYKDAYIKQSGYRYVDINEAVGADVSTSWYSGLLSSDNVHPSGEGAKVIAERFMADIPELKN